MMTLVIDESYFELFLAAETYIRAKSIPSIQSTIDVDGTTMDKNDDFINHAYENIEVNWRSNFKDETPIFGILRSYELSFEMKYKDKVMNSYLPYILQQGKAIQEQTKIRKIILLQNMTWISSSELDNSITFSIIPMNSELKLEVIHDLNTFMKAEEYYQRIGKAKKRTYLISGPVGIDKSKLIYTMANHLNYNIYEADLSAYSEGDDIRNLLLHCITRNILVFNDIESPVDVQPSYKKRKGEAVTTHQVQKHSLILKLLRSINGLWLPWGNELIIVLTTNDREDQPNSVNSQLD